MKLAIQTADIEATVTSLKAVSEASINDLGSKYITSTGVIVRYEKLSTKGDYAPDDQVNGTGYWVKNKSNPFYIVDNSYDFAANNAIDKSQDLILLSIYGRVLCSDFLQFSTFVTEQLNIKTWESCNNHEKKFLIDCNIKESSISSINDIINKQAYLQSEEGMTEQMSINYINARFSDFADNQRDSCRRRIESKDLCACLAKYLTSSDVRLLTAQVKDEYSYFHNYGYKDLIYFIESSNGRESDGLEQQGYTLNSGTISDLRNELLLILKDGVYGSL